MKAGPIHWLLVSAAAELIAACLLGFVMLLPMQPWGAALRQRLPPTRGLLSVHLDLIMLALMQLAAAAAMRAVPATHDRPVALLLVVGGWMNVTPYVWRLAGVNAFALAGGPLQRLAALFALASTLALTAAWTILLVGWL
jgi:hypothetical protein